MTDRRASCDNPYETYEVGDKIYWMGFADRQAGFSNNPYLIVSDEGATLIDPGSVLHYHVVAKKIVQLIKPDAITTIIVQHQDPDLCASIPKFEALIEHPIRVVVPPRAAVFMQYYGITSELITPADGSTLSVSGRALEFHYTPYVHFAQAMMTWDASTGTLFSSDVFGAFTKRWRLFADEDYVEETRSFIEPYVGSQGAWLYALERTRRLRPKRICPQHGCIIDRDIDKYLDAIAKFQVATGLPKEWRDVRK